MENLNHWRGRFGNLSLMLLGGMLVCACAYVFARSDYFALLGCLLAGAAAACRLWSRLSLRDDLMANGGWVVVLSICFTASLSVHWNLIYGLFLCGIDLGMSDSESSFWHGIYWVGPVTGLFALALWLILEMAAGNQQN